VGYGEAFGIYTCQMGLSNADTMINMVAEVSKCERQVLREIKLIEKNYFDGTERCGLQSYWILDNNKA
jgi:hypothetical protein